MTEHGEREHGDESIEELADEAIEDNPDDQTRRETFELELMEDGRSEEGGAIDLDEEGDHHDSKDRAARRARTGAIPRGSSPSRGA
jgi:hypothetical protein